MGQGLSSSSMFISCLVHNTPMICRAPVLQILMNACNGQIHSVREHCVIIITFWDSIFGVSHIQDCYWASQFNLESQFSVMWCREPGLQTCLHNRIIFLIFSLISHIRFLKVSFHRIALSFMLDCSRTLFYRCIALMSPWHPSILQYINRLMSVTIIELNRYGW